MLYILILTQNIDVSTYNTYYSQYVQNNYRNAFNNYIADDYA